MPGPVGDSGGVDGSARRPIIARRLDRDSDRASLPNDPPGQDLTRLHRRPPKRTNHDDCDHTYRMRGVIRNVPHWPGVWYMFTAYCYVMNKTITVKCPYAYFWKGEGIADNAPQIDVVPLA